jgi:hypothetical protein
MVVHWQVALRKIFADQNFTALWVNSLTIELVVISKPTFGETFIAPETQTKFD